MIFYEDLGLDSVKEDFEIATIMFNIAIVVCNLLMDILIILKSS